MMKSLAEKNLLRAKEMQTVTKVGMWNCQRNRNTRRSIFAVRLNDTCVTESIAAMFYNY